MKDEKRYEDVMSSILCNFVAVYCEYKGGNKGMNANKLI